ncbi:MAG TPA: hypothetical protein VJ770_10280 [Stellaceae bacterium]|nr:hypothetical protein [Stellaceae bacterium]
MTDAMHSKPEGEVAAIGRLFGSALVQGSEFYMNTHKELLANLGVMLEGWLQLNRATFNNSSRMLQRLQECQSLGELLRLQQEWASDYWQWTAATVPAAADSAPAAQRAMARPREPAETARADIRVRREPATENAAARATAAE